MFRWIILICLSISIFSNLGCSHNASVAVEQKQETLILYSELDSKFTEDLVASFNKKAIGNVKVQAIYELTPKNPQPDLVLAEKRTLNGLKLDGLLKSVYLPASDRLPNAFYDGDNCWYGIFYDPTVFLINQQFSRIIGQNNIKSWADLASSKDIRIAIENLSDSNSTQNFLAAFADKFGEDASLDYFSQINHKIIQYTKFPFTSIRMTAVGDADLAITRQSYVFKYLENKFPAYVIIPEEGSPANLYGVGVFKNCNADEVALQFMDWLLIQEDVQKVSLANNTGFLFLIPQSLTGPVADAEKVWLNKSYLVMAAQETLTNKWLAKVRFTK